MLITKIVIVNRDVAEIFRLWRNLENFPLFMRNIKSVTLLDNGVSHWVMSGALGFQVQWDARTTALEENRCIAWESIRGDMQISGKIDFDPLEGQRTKITATIFYELGKIGNAAAHFFFDPETLLEQDLDRAREYFEQLNSGDVQG